MKDWPASDDFKKVLPTRYDDLIQNLPISKYTDRDSLFNLASSLSDFFVKPDLGPKMYIAYSSINDIKWNDQEGTTNLHVDISDAFNLMIYVGETKSNDKKLIIDDSNNNNNDKNNDNKSTKTQLFCSNKEKKYFHKLISFDQSQYNRYLNGEKPGALWHIFRPQDAEKIREFLRMVVSFFILSILLNKTLFKSF